MFDPDDMDYQEAASEAKFARQRLNRQIRIYDYRDPEYQPDYEEEDDENF